MKRRLFAIIAAALAVGSCSKSETVDVSSSRQIGINAYTSGISSRASEIKDVVALQNAGFKLYAYRGTADATAGSTTFASGQITPHISDDVSYSNSKWTFAGGKSYYWPQDEQVQFFAYAPKDITVDWTNAASGTWPSFTYTVPAVANQKDLMAANELNTSETTGKVSLGFNHLLTQINFQCVGAVAGFTYKVTGITLSGVNTTGTFTYNGVTNSTPGTWSAQGTTGNYQYALNGTPTVEGTTASTMATPTNALMLLPQTTPEGAQIKVSYTVYKGSTVVQDATKTASLAGVLWDPNKKILYTITLPVNAKELNVTGKVDNWGAEEEIDPDPDYSTMFDGGDGTYGSPYLISTPQQLKNMGLLLSNGVSGYFELTKDIDLAGIDWTPINVPEDTFFGIDNADFRYITNLNVNNKNGGLFGTVYGGEVHFLAITDFTINSTIPDGYNGAMFGEVKGYVGIEDVYVRNGVINGQGNVGAITGKNSGEIYFSYSEFSNCTSYGTTISNIAGSNTGTITEND